MTEPTTGGVIAEARKKIGMSQKELTEKIRKEDGTTISPQYLNDIERDRRSLSSDHLIRQFAKVLGLNADYLHYLSGRFPETDRKKKLELAEFEVKMKAFRRSPNK